MPKEIEEKHARLLKEMSFCLSEEDMNKICRFLRKEYRQYVSDNIMSLGEHNLLSPHEWRIEFINKYKTEFKSYLSDDPNANYSEDEFGWWFLDLVVQSE